MFCTKCKPDEYTHIQILDDPQRAMANSNLRLKEALVIGSYAGQVPAQINIITIDVCIHYTF